MNTKSDSLDPFDLAKTNVASSVIWQAFAPFTQTADSLVAHAYELIWKQIVEGERQPGERLIAGELARELNVSRTPVQQALYQLSQTGLVTMTAGKGFHVTIFNATDVRDLYDLRTILEVAAITAAVPHVPLEEIKACQSLIERIRQLPKAEQGSGFVYSDIHFHHSLIAQHSGNRRLAEAVALQRAQMSLFIIDGTRQPGGIEAALSEHELIIEAMLERDIAKAARRMEEHIQRVKEDVLHELANMRPPRVRRFRSVDLS